MLAGKSPAGAEVAVDFDVGDFAELALANEFVARFEQVRRAAALQADLDGAIVFARGGDHRLAFDDVVADRLLHVHVGAALAGLDHRQAVPMIGRADEHDLRLSLGKQLAVVAERWRLLLRRLAAVRRARPRLVDHLAIDVAQADDVDRRDLDQVKEVGLAVPAAADERDAERLFALGGKCADCKRANDAALRPVLRNCRRYMVASRWKRVNIVSRRGAEDAEGLQMRRLGRR